MKSSQLDYVNIRGIHIYLELRSTRLFVGHLKQDENKYELTYEARYLNHKKAIPLGPELPLTKMVFTSKDIFPSFADRIPSRENPAYSEYCAHFGISPQTQNTLVLLATVGSVGPSSFVFEPDWGVSFTSHDLKAFRKELGLSTRDFAICFGISPATVVNIENGITSGSDVLKLIEVFCCFPEVAIFYIKKYASALHSKTKERMLTQLKNKMALSFTHTQPLFRHPSPARKRPL